MSESEHVIENPGETLKPTENGVVNGGDEVSQSSQVVDSNGQNGGTTTTTTTTTSDEETEHVKLNEEKIYQKLVGSSSSSNDGDSSDRSSSGSSDDLTSKPVVKPSEVDANSYDAVFPSLPSTGNNFTENNVWQNVDKRLQIKRHLTTTQVFHVPVEERLYRGTNNFGNETNKKCEDIANRLGVKVELSCSKDQSLHIVLSGQEDKVLEAKRCIIEELQTKLRIEHRVPKEHHKYLIGKQGATLKELQEKTCTQIQIPKPDSNSDVISISGPKDGIEQAIHEIQLIVDEQSKTGLERLAIPKLYHPWIRGVNNETCNEIAQRTGAKVNIPPPHSDKEEITVSGDREKVDQAVAEIKQIYLEKSKLKITRLAIQIAKSQHKLIIGQKGSTVQETFRDYDVYVQVPKSDSNSETIYLYGEETKLGGALSHVCQKANSIVNIKIEAPSWLYRYLIGEKGANISKITGDYPNTHVEFEQDDRITLEGPPEEVEKVKERLEKIIIHFKTSLACEEVLVDSKLYPLIGKQTARLNKEFGVLVRAPQMDNTTAGVSAPTSHVLVRIEGAPDAVQKAKLEFLELVKKAENERTKDIIIDQKYHSNLIGKSGKNLNELRAKFNDVQIQIPSQEEKSDVIKIKGNKNDVEKCHKHLLQFYKEMQESNYQDELHIFKQFHRMLIGKQGAFIRKIREDTQTRIEVPAEDSESDSILIVGKQENVFKARRLIEDKVKELLKIEEDFIDVPSQFHTALIGKGGAIIKQIRKDCGGVLINFPPENATSDRITLKGPRDEIERAKQELLKMAKQKNDSNYTEEIHVKSEFHRFLVGKKGTSINSMRDKHQVRIILPTVSALKDNNNNKDQPNQTDIITIVGKEENVKAVRVEIEQIVKNLEEQITDEVQVDPKWHKNFTAKRAKLINSISNENCSVSISFPKQSTSNVVVLKGPRDAVDSAKRRILECVYEFENQITIEVQIAQKYHVSLIGKKGATSSEISNKYNVEIQFPEKSLKAAASSTEQVNQIDEIQPSPKSDTIKISGLKENCEQAKQALLDLVPIQINVDFAQKFHRNLLVNKAECLRDITSKYEVQVKLPQKGNLDSNYVTLTGTKDNLELAKEAINKLLNEFELKNFTIEINEIKSELIPQFRGKNGTEAAKLEKKFDVRIEFSRKGEPDRIVIKGIKENVMKCEEFIRKKINDEQSKLVQEIQIDNRVHSRLIGQKGKAIAKIMDKYKVEIKFSGRQSDLVIVKGDTLEQVEDACDYLKNLEEEYMQDVIDKETYTHPSKLNDHSNESKQNGSSKGFVVNGAPWHQQLGELAPDTNNMDDFPTISSAVADGQPSTNKMTWGPSRK